MRLSSWLQVVLGVVGVSLGVIGLASSYRQPTRSLLLVTVSGLRSDAVSAEKTPNLWRIARQGKGLSEVWATSPLALPSLADMLAVDPLDPKACRYVDTCRLPSDTRTLPEILAAEGYWTTAIGGQGDISLLSGVYRGFNWVTLPSSPFDAAVTPEELQDRYKSRRSGWYSSESVLQNYLTYMVSLQSGTPAFFWLHFGDLEQLELAGNERSDYDEAVRRLDEHIGTVISAIDTSGHAGYFRTVIASLHGQALGDAFETRHGVFPSQSVMRVPLIISEGAEDSTDADRPEYLGELGEYLLDMMGLEAVAKLTHESNSSNIQPGISERYFALPVDDIRIENGTIKYRAGGVESIESSEQARVLLEKMKDAHFLFGAGALTEALGKLAEAMDLYPNASLPKLEFLRIAQQGKAIIGDGYDAAVQAIVDDLRSAETSDTTAEIDIIRALSLGGEQSASLDRAFALAADDSLTSGEKIAVSELLVAAGALEEAISLLDSVVRTERECPELWEWLGDLRRRSGNSFSASTAYRTALEAPRARTPNLYAKLGDELAKLGELHAALENYSEAVTIDRFYLYPHTRAAEVFLEMGEQGAAAHAVVSGVKTTGFLVTDALKKAMALEAKGLIGPALGEIEEGLAVLPKQRALLLAKARLADAAGRSDVSREILAPLVGEGHVSAMVELARLEALSGNFEEAMTLLSKAREGAGPAIAARVRSEPAFQGAGPDSELATMAANFVGRAKPKGRNPK